MSQDVITTPATGSGDSGESNTRARIMQAAIRLFSQHGFDATPVREIVREAGVTKPVLYYYFKNKEDLFQEIISDLLETFGAELYEICSDTRENFSEQLTAIADLYFVTTHSQPDLIRFVNSIFFSGLFERVFDFHTFWDEEIRLVAEMFERAQAQGKIRTDISPVAMANHFLGMILHWMQGMVYCPETISTDPSGRTIVKVLMEGIAGPGNAQIDG